MRQHSATISCRPTTAHLHHIATSGDEAARQAIWPALRKLVARHREFSDTRWALRPEETAEFGSLLPLLQSESFAELYGHLFEFRVPFVDGVSARHDGHDAHEEAVKAHRVSAMTEIVRAGGVEAVEQFARSVEAPGLVGTALADAAGGDNTDTQVLMRLDSPDTAVAAAARRYFVTRFPYERLGSARCATGRHGSFAGCGRRAVESLGRPSRRMGAGRCSWR